MNEYKTCVSVCAHMKRVKLGQPWSMSFTSHLLRARPLRDVICFTAPSCTGGQNIDDEVRKSMGIALSVLSIYEFILLPYA